MEERLTLQQIVETVDKACRPGRLWDTLQTITHHHRIQASEGFRAAAQEMERLLHLAGVTAQIDVYPADRRTMAFTQCLFREWNCREAWLEITAPWQELAADFSREELSLIQRSAPDDFSQQELEVVYVPDDADPSQPMPQLKDAVLFVENGFERWIDTALREGAAAIVTVSMPEILPVRRNMADDPRLAHAHANLSFHHFREETEKALRGFALSPATGRRLREACLTLAEQGQRPTVRCKVDAQFCDGHLENVNAVLPGRTDEEILLVAHLCHPRSCVNDNASGAACAVEAMRMLSDLVERGQLPRPQRTIRMLLIPEFTGTYAFLAQDDQRRKRIRAGFNMDMVAGRQDGTAGPMLAVDTPDCAASFAGDLAEALFDILAQEAAFGGVCRVPMLSCRRVPFVFGSDHSILSDPTVNIPTVALTQWPDKTYHTSADDLAHLDPALLRRAAVMAAAYCYTLADFTPDLAGEILPWTAMRFFQRSDVQRRRGADGTARQYLRRLAWHTLEGYETWFTGHDAEAFRQTAAAERQAWEAFLGPQEPWPSLEGPVPVRRFTAQLAVRSVRALLNREQQAQWDRLAKDHPAMMARMDEIFYETDGKRSVAEIARQLRCRTGEDFADQLPAFFEFFHHLDLVEWRSECYDDSQEKGDTEENL